VRESCLCVSDRACCVDGQVLEGVWLWGVGWLWRVVLERVGEIESLRETEKLCGSDGDCCVDG